MTRRVFTRLRTWCRNNGTVWVGPGGRPLGRREFSIGGTSVAISRPHPPCRSKNIDCFRRPRRQSVETGPGPSREDPTGKADPLAFRDGTRTQKNRVRRCTSYFRGEKAPPEVFLPDLALRPCVVDGGRAAHLRFGTSLTDPACALPSSARRFFRPPRPSSSFRGKQFLAPLMPSRICTEACRRTARGRIGRRRCHTLGAEPATNSDVAKRDVTVPRRDPT